MYRLSVCLILLFASIVRADPVTLDKPIYAEVFIKGTTKPQKVTGNLTGYDETGFTLQIVKENRQMAWADITPTSAFTLRQRVIDKNKATDWLELGRFGWTLGAKEQAQAALRTAVKMDASLKKDSDAILASATEAPKGDKPESSTDAPASKDDAGDQELIKKAGDQQTPVAQPGRKKGAKVEVVKFTPATPEQAAAAMKRVRDQQTKITEQLSVKFTEFETDHFIVFTDWDEREHNFLKKNLEEANRVVSKQFDMSPKDNIFVGKLPVYMISKFSDFAKFASKIDNFPVSNQVAGYYHGNDQGIGHMVMWKPNESLTGNNNLKEAERLWGYVLIHEFTHAFLARYRTNEFIPRWLNEGIAEVIASSQLPAPDRYRIAQYMAWNGGDMSMLFDDEYMPSGQYYPVMQTMVELLVQTDRKKFIKMVNDIKDGVEPEEALQTNFKTDYAKFARAWREWAKKQVVR